MPSSYIPPGEGTSLLPKPTPADSGERPQYRKWFTETWLLTRSSIPVILAYMLQNSLQTASVLIVGRLPPEALATAAFSYMFAMASAWLIALGGTTALDTLVSSSFTGPQNKHDLGVFLQRGIVVLSGLCAVVAVIWAASEHIFRALGQGYVTMESAEFLRLLAPMGWATFGSSA
ncbi:hypothetical protein DL767_004697 [Monosporascus sp. MG133]|nr:hypothetical protein DL767_004697 [Monosporascus sp. MG133]